MTKSGKTAIRVTVSALFGLAGVILHIIFFPSSNPGASFREGGYFGAIGGGVGYALSSIVLSFFKTKNKEEDAHRLPTAPAGKTKCDACGKIFPSNFYLCEVQGQGFVCEECRTGTSRKDSV